MALDRDADSSPHSRSVIGAQPAANNDTHNTIPRSQHPQMYFSYSLPPPGQDCPLLPDPQLEGVIAWSIRTLVVPGPFGLGRHHSQLSQIWVSVLTAALGNLPLAVILITGALRILRLTATRLWFLDPGTPARRLPLVP